MGVDKMVESWKLQPLKNNPVNKDGSKSKKKGEKGSKNAGVDQGEREM